MTAINLQMIGTPKAVYQSSNINQLSPELGNIAYQVNDSLLAGGESVKVDALLSILNLTSSYSQSDKISSGYSVNILAQQLAKTLADVSAKIYANQSPKFTGNQSGEYLSGCNSGEYLSTPKRGSAKRGEFTPLAKGDFSHLSKEANYPHWQGLIWITIRGRIEFLQSIKGKVIEFCQSIKKGKIELLDTIKKERIEFLESIKKGSQSATLGDVDIKYRASENINISLLLWYGKYQFLGSIPNRSNSFRPRVLSQLPKLIPASDAADSNCALSSGVILIWNVGDNPFPFSVLSLFGVDMYVRNPLVCYLLCTYSNMKYVQNKTPSNDITSITQGLTTNDTDTIEVAMQDINTPVTGRTSLTPNQSYRWLFLALNRSDYTAKPCRIAVTAPNEHDARLMLVRDYILSFAGRLPAIGGKHHA